MASGTNYGLQPANKAPDIQGVLGHDLYSQPIPTIDGVKQVLETIKDRVQALSPEQMQMIGYLQYLQSRPLHAAKKDKPYDQLIEHVRDNAYRVAPPGFFIRVIEALIPRPISVDGKTFEKMKKEGNAQR